MCSVRVEIIPNVWCGASFVAAHMIWYHHLGAVLCAGFGVWKCDFRSLLGFQGGVGRNIDRYKNLGVRKILENDSGCLKKVLCKMHTDLKR